MNIRINSNNSRSWLEEHTIVYSNKGTVVGEIQRIHLDFSASLGGEPTVYVASQCGRNYGIKACQTLLDAYHFLGISTKEAYEYYEVVELDGGGEFAGPLIAKWISEHNYPKLYKKRFYHNGYRYSVSSCEVTDDWRLGVCCHYYTWEKRHI